MNIIDDFVLSVLHQQVYEGRLFFTKVGLSTRPRRSHEDLPKRTKKSKQVAEPLSKVTFKCLPFLQEKEDPPSKKRKRGEDVGRSSSSKSLKIHIPEDVLNHSCTNFLFIDVLISQLSDGLKDWNKKFVTTKFLHEEYQRRYEALVEENKSLEVDLMACRTELSNSSTLLSMHHEEAEWTHFELRESRAEVTDVFRSLRSAEAKILALKAENKRLQAELSESTKDEATLKIVEAYKDSYEFKSIIQDEVEKERNHIFDVEVKGLERQCIEDGFIRGFLKGTRLVQRQTGVNIEGLTWSQVSEDPSPDLEDDAESVMPFDVGSDDEIVSK